MVPELERHVDDDDEQQAAGNHDEGESEQLGQVLIRLGRKSDFIARYGGEEFAIVLPNTDTEGAIEAGMERVSRIQSWPDWHPPAEMRRRFLVHGIGAGIQVDQRCGRARLRRR